MCCLVGRVIWASVGRGGFRRVRIYGLSGLNGLGLEFSAAWLRLICRCNPEVDADGLEHVDIEAVRGEGDTDPRGASDDAGGDLDKPQAQRCELGRGQYGGLGARWCLAGARQHGHRAIGRGLVDMDRQEVAAVVMPVPLERKLLIAVHDIAGIFDIQRHRRRRPG